MTSIKYVSQFILSMKNFIYYHLYILINNLFSELSYNKWAFVSFYVNIIYNTATLLVLSIA